MQEVDFGCIFELVRLAKPEIRKTFSPTFRRDRSELQENEQRGPIRNRLIDLGNDCSNNRTALLQPDTTRGATAQRR